MDKKEAIAYLKRKGKLDSAKYNETTEKELREQDENRIEEVMTSGKIYGDPAAEMDW